MMVRSFAIVGPGRVGQALAHALCAVGLELRGVLGRNKQHSLEAADELDVLWTVPPATTWSEIAHSAELVFITTHDSAIESVAHTLAADLGERVPASENRRQPVALHASGALTSEVLSPLRNVGFHVGSFHPMQAVTGTNPELLRGIAWGIEGDSKARAAASELARMLEGTPLHIEADAKPLYHAAACFVSNYLMVLLNAGSTLLASSGVDETKAVQALVPLMAGALTNARHQGLPDALTGPIERGDVATVKSHLAALAQNGVSQDMQKLYCMLGMEAVRMAELKGSISDKQAQALRSALYVR